MGGIISGAALPHLADLVFRATVLPLTTSLWLGGGWAGAGVAMSVFFIWHFCVFVPSLGLSLLNVPFFTSLNDETGKLNGYQIVLPALAIGFSAIGALLPWLLALPSHLFPFGHLFSRRPLTDKSKVDCGYAISTLVVSLIVILGSWLPYEFCVAFLGGTSIYVPIVGAAAPPVLVFLLAVPACCCLNKKRSKLLFGNDSSSTIGVTLGKLFLVAILGSVSVVLVAYFLRDFDYTWMTASLEWVLLVGVGIAYYAAKGRHIIAAANQNHEHASDPLMATQMKGTLVRA